MSHLGERLTALVDGELGHDERDRALAHLATCPQCRSEAEELRRLKGRLRSLRSAAPTSEFLLGLNRLADADPVDLGERDRPGDPAAAAGPRGPFGPGPIASPGRPGLVGPPAPGRARAGGRRRLAAGGPRGRAAAGPKAFRGRYLVAGAATLAVLGVGAVSFTAGAEPDRLPQVSPALERFAVEHALTANEIPVTDTTAVLEGPVGP